MIKIQLDSTALAALLSDMTVDEQVELRKGVAAALGPMVARKILEVEDRKWQEFLESVAKQAVESLAREVGLLRNYTSGSHSWSLTPEARNALTRSVRDAAAALDKEVHAQIIVEVEKQFLTINAELVDRVELAVARLSSDRITREVRDRVQKVMQEVVTSLDKAGA